MAPENGARALFSQAGGAGGVRIERDVWLASRRHRLAYGLASVGLSLALGWAAALAFRRRF